MGVFCVMWVTKLCPIMIITVKMARGSVKANQTTGEELLRPNKLLRRLPPLRIAVIVAAVYVRMVEEVLSFLGRLPFLRP